MTPAQTTWTVLIAAQAVVNVPFLLNLLKGKPMVYPELAAPLAEITASINALPAKIAQAVTDAEAAAAQDRTDSVAAVQAQADALKALVGS